MKEIIEQSTEIVNIEKHFDQILKQIKQDDEQMTNDIQQIVDKYQVKQE